MIKKIKDVSGINGFRRHNLDLRKNVGAVKDTWNQYLKLVLLGSQSRFGLRDFEKTVLEEIRDSGDSLSKEMLREAIHSAEKYRMEAEELREDSIKYALGKELDRGGLDNSKVALYFPGNIFYSSSGFSERFRGKFSKLETLFCDGGKTDLELSKGNHLRKSYENGEFYISPVETLSPNRTAAVIYFTPCITEKRFNGKEKFARLNAVNKGREAVEIIGSYLKDVPLGCVGLKHGKE